MGQPNRRLIDLTEDAVEQPGPDRTLFSEFLISARRRAGCTIDDIAVVTKVPVRHLEALEHGRVEELPRGVYRRAIVRTYSAAVGLDPTIVVERFAQVYGADSAFSEWQTVPPPTRPPTATLVRPSSSASITAPATLPTPRRASSDAIAPAPRSRGLRAAAVAVSGALLAATVGYFIVQSSAPSVREAPPSSSESSQSVPFQATPVAPVTPPVPPVDRVVQTSASGPATAVATTETEAAVAAPPTAQLSEPAPVETRLVVTSSPSGARVTIDGIGWGVTPVTVRHLSPGLKSVRVTMDGYLGQEQQINLGEDGAAAVRLTLVPRP